MQATITQAAALGGKFAQSRPDRPIIRASGLIAAGRAIPARNPVGPPLAHLESLDQMNHGGPPGDGRHHLSWKQGLQHRLVEHCTRQ